MSTDAARQFDQEPRPTLEDELEELGEQQRQQKHLSLAKATGALGVEEVIVSDPHYTGAIIDQTIDHMGRE